MVTTHSSGGYKARCRCDGDHDGNGLTHLTNQAPAERYAESSRRTVQNDTQWRLSWFEVEAILSPPREILCCHDALFLTAGSRRADRGHRQPVTAPPQDARPHLS